MQESVEDDVLSTKKSNHVQRKIASRKSTAKIDPRVEEQFLTGRLYGEEHCSLIMFVACTVYM